MKNVVLVGGGGHFHSCFDVINTLDSLKIIGLVDKKFIHLPPSYEFKYLGNDIILEKLKDKTDYYFISTGSIGVPKIRVMLYEKIKNFGGDFPIIISPMSHVSRSAVLLDGTIVMHFALINAHAKVGRNCIINSQALLEHDVIIGDHCHISTGVKINGSVEVGSSSFIGSGSVIREGIKIGNNVIIQAGSVVMHDIPNDIFYKNYYV